MPATTEIAVTPDLGIRLFATPSVSEWLTQRGVRRTPNTLRKLRCTGGGPTYRKLNGKPYYTEDDLADWIWSRLSGPIRSTSETYSTEDLENALGAGSSRQLPALDRPPAGRTGGRGPLISSPNPLTRQDRPKTLAIAAAARFAEPSAFQAKPRPPPGRTQL
jgi:hypothetical protein